MRCLRLLVGVWMTGLCIAGHPPEPWHQQPPCPGRHSCSFSLNSTRDNSDLGCSCDTKCRVYGDCCRDSQYYNKAEQTRNVNEYVCVEYARPDKSKDHVYVRAKCWEDWDNAEVQALCLKGNTLPDTTQRLLVTSSHTGRTYLNLYCAICNGEELNSLEMWHAMVTCEITTATYNNDDSVHDKYYDFVPIRNSSSLSHDDYDIMYNDGVLGIIPSGLNVSSFKPCQVDFTVPSNRQRPGTHCSPTIKTCNDSESEEHERTLCQSYTAAVYHGDLTFRNQHCASCNGYKQFTCEPGPSAFPPLLLPNSSYPLTMILHITSLPNTFPAGICSTGSVWDFYSRECRKILCPKPDETFLYGKCVSLSTNDHRPLCTFQHSCTLPQVSDRGCSCDSTCRVYGDCCRDSQYYNEAEQTRNVNEYICNDKYVGHERSTVYIKGKCSENWDNVEVQKLCLKGNTLPDATKLLPVTSTTTALSYVNYYCAICNGEEPDFLRMWKASVQCFDLPEDPSMYGQDYPVVSHEGNYPVVFHEDDYPVVFHEDDYPVVFHEDDYPVVFREDYSVVFHEGTWGIILPSLGLGSFTECPIYFIIPEDIRNFTTQCLPMIKTCSDAGSEEHVQTLCQSYAAVVYSGSHRFRNQHCASCNGHEYYTCMENVLHSSHMPPQFSVLLDFTDHTGSKLVGKRDLCGIEEVWDDYHDKCRKVFCHKPDEKFTSGKCVSVQDDVTLTTKDQGSQKDGSLDTIHNTSMFKTDAAPRLMPTIASTAEKPAALNTINTTSNPLSTSSVNTSVPASQDPGHHISAPLNTTSPYNGCLMRVQLSEGEFTRQTDGSVHVSAYGRTYQDGEYEPTEGGVLVCLSKELSADSSDKFSSTLGWVGLTGLGLSCLALVLHLITFCLVSSLRNLSGRCLASLCLSLLAAYITFLLNWAGPFSQAGCAALAAAVYYLFLCSFAWMTTIALDVWWTFRLTQKELRVAGGSQARRFLAYSLCSWLLPAVCMAILVTVDQVEPQGVSEDFLPRLGEGMCWISHRKSLLVFFVTPVAAFTLMNVVFFASTAAIIAKMSGSAATPAAAEVRQRRRKRYWTFVRLAVLMGLTWTTGIVAGSLDVEALWYIFVVLNTLQGVFIFLAFTCRTKIFQEVGSKGHRLLDRAVSLVSRRPLQTDTGPELQQESVSMSNVSTTSTSLQCEK